MKRIPLLAALAAAIAVRVVAAEPSATPDPRTLALCALLADDVAAHRNAVRSPYSLSCAMGMAAVGARGRTFDEIRDAFALPAIPEAVAPEAARRRKALTDAALASPGGELLVANSLWWQTADPLRPAFASALREGFDAEARPLASAPANSIGEINRWIAEKTRGHIPAAVGALPDTTRLLLVNAVYFKMKWDCEFDRKATREQEFLPESGPPQRARFMSLLSEFPVLAGANGLYRAVRMPYKGGRFALEIILPHPGRTVADVLEAWRTGVVPEPLRGTAPDPAPWFGRESRGGADPFRDAFPLRLPVEVRLPRFRIESRASLVAPLRALGVATAFRDDGAADFSGVFERERRNLALADVRQAALVDVDEEGTTAAAATHAVGCGCASYSPTHMDFTVDRPFLFLLRAADDGPLLFAGVVFDAAAAQSGRPR